MRALREREMSNRRRGGEKRRRDGREEKTGREKREEKRRKEFEGVSVSVVKAKETEGVNVIRYRH